MGRNQWHRLPFPHLHFSSSFYKISASFFPVEEKKTKTLANIVSAKNKIRHEIQELNERLKQSKDAISKFKDEIRTLETQDGKPPVARKLEVMS